MIADHGQDLKKIYKKYSEGSRVIQVYKNVRLLTNKYEINAPKMELGGLLMLCKEYGFGLSRAEVRHVFLRFAKRGLELDFAQFVEVL